ncbi:restriction endonuclease subunit S [Collinsella tanakaei]|nr:restriction endonuclease subunit S [Collinsella tanakaei]
MGELAKKVTAKNLNRGVKEVLTNSAELGIVSQTDYFDREIAKEQSIDGYYLVENGDFVYNPRISVSAPVGPIGRNELGRMGVVSPLYTVFRLTAPVDGAYLSQYFVTTCWHRFMKLEGNSGARSDRFSIGDSTFFEMPIPIPSILEQRLIGALFRDLDDLITLRQRERISGGAGDI